MKVRYEAIVIGLLLMAIILIMMGCTAWNNTTVPLVLTGAACAFASEGVINRYER